MTIINTAQAREAYEIGCSTKLVGLSKLVGLYFFGSCMFSCMLFFSFGLRLLPHSHLSDCSMCPSSAFFGMA